MNIDPARAATNWLSDAFFVDFAALAKRQNIDPLELAAVLVSESGMRPNAHNAGGAYGIFQAIPSTLRGLGWSSSPDSFLSLSATEQLPYLEKFMSSVSKMTGIHSWPGGAAFHWALFYPATIHRGFNVNSVIVSRAEDAPSYDGNRQLDYGNKGFITYGDIIRFTDSVKSSNVYQSIATRLANIGSYGPSMGTYKSALVIAMYVATVYAGYYVYANRGLLLRPARA